MNERIKAMIAAGDRALLGKNAELIEQIESMARHQAATEEERDIAIAQRNSNLLAFMVMLVVSVCLMVALVVVVSR